MNAIGRVNRNMYTDCLYPVRRVRVDKIDSRETDFKTCDIPSEKKKIDDFQIVIP